MLNNGESPQGHFVYLIQVPFLAISSSHEQKITRSSLKY